MAGRTDTHQLTVLNHTTGSRHSFVGSPKECNAELEAKLKLWKGDVCDHTITKRAA